MKNCIKILFISFILIFISGCVSKREVNLIGFNTNETLIGIFNSRDGTVTVTMPDGEILSGSYTTLNDDGSSVSVGVGGGRTSGGRHGGGSFSTMGLGFNFGGGSSDMVKYALLTSETSDLRMEIRILLRSWSGGGFGEARTNDGREYRIQF